MPNRLHCRTCGRLFAARKRHCHHCGARRTRTQRRKLRNQRLVAPSWVFPTIGALNILGFLWFGVHVQSMVFIDSSQINAQHLAWSSANQLSTQQNTRYRPPYAAIDAVSIEPDSVIDYFLNEAYAEWIIRYVRMHGGQCDSISALYVEEMSDTVHLVCDQRCTAHVIMARNMELPWRSLKILPMWVEVAPALRPAPKPLPAHCPTTPTSKKVW